MLGVQVGVRQPGHVITTLSGRPPLQQASSQGDRQLQTLHNSPDAQETVEVRAVLEIGCFSRIFFTMYVGAAKRISDRYKRQMWPERINVFLSERLQKQR